MAQNYIQEGDVMPYVVPDATTIVRGAGVLVGDLLGVALGNGSAGDTIQLALEGVFEMPKAAGAISQGAKIYWNATDKNLTTTASGNKLAGYAFVGAASGDATVQLRLQL